ncbi:MAG: DNA repair protein RecO [Luminiphilus sp.]|nr:DNA repair protein RecO [Luminiphilus sp.]
MSKTLQPAWVLSRRKYQDSGLLLEIYTAHDGRLGAVAKGAHRKQRGGTLSSILQAFTPILVRLGGQSDLKYISAVESAGQTLSMQDAQMLSGLYLNELLLRLSPRFDSSPELFATYGVTLKAISGGVEVEAHLRRFELELLNQLGYQINWRKDSQRSDIHPSRVYHYAPENGFEQTESSEGILGSELQAISFWIDGQSTLSDATERVVRQITRRSIDQLLGGRALNVRAVARQWSEQRVVK